VCGACCVCVWLSVWVGVVCLGVCGVCVYRWLVSVVCVGVLCRMYVFMGVCGLWVWFVLSCLCVYGCGCVVCAWGVFVCVWQCGVCVGVVCGCGVCLYVGVVSLGVCGVVCFCV